MDRLVPPSLLSALKKKKIFRCLWCINLFIQRIGEKKANKEWLYSSRMLAALRCTWNSKTEMLLFSWIQLTFIRDSQHFFFFLFLGEIRLLTCSFWMKVNSTAISLTSAWPSVNTSAHALVFLHRVGYMSKTLNAPESTTSSSFFPSSSLCYNPLSSGEH